MVRRLLRIALLVVGVAVLFVLVRNVGVATIAGLLRQVGWAFLVVSALYFTHVCVRAAALWRVTGGLRYRDVLRIRLYGEAVEMLTFTGPFLAEPTKGVMLTRHGLSRADAIRGVGLEYGLYTLTSAWMAVFALSLLVSTHALPAALHQPVLFVIGGMIVVTVAAAIAAATGRVPIGAARGAEVIAIEFLGQALLAAEIFVTVRVLGYAFTSLQSVLVEGAVKFISVAFFFVPGQIGAQESVYTLIFQAMGLPGAVGLTMALVRRVRALIVAAIALAVTYGL
ncbi:MAG TPA: lysylphosphatidylglycerol synthase domain-containing protein [Vicinamibacterales bacterium]|nr:lysylphosphatidylglycerol synthase domain-containing protein [Vicinamibacterales bacterium]